MSDQLPALLGDMPTVHPIHLVVTDDLRRSRLTIFFRLLLAIPALIILQLLAYVGQVVMFLAWVYALFTGRLNSGIRDVLAYWIRYQAQTVGYVCLLTQRYPSFAEE